MKFHSSTKFKPFVPRWARVPIMGMFIFAKTFIGVGAFKLFETAMHTTDFGLWAMAGLASVSILLPIAGLNALVEDIE